MKFKVGDKVKVRNCMATDGLEYARTYEILTVAGPNDTKDRLVTIGNKSGCTIFYEDRFELFVEEKKVEMKFKKGSKVKCLINHGNQFTKNKIYTLKVDSTYNWATVEEDDSGQVNGMGLDYFILVVDELQDLVDAANKGLIALNQLKNCREKVETLDTKLNKSAHGDKKDLPETEIFHVIGNYLACGYLSGRYVLRVKPKPAFEPFNIGEAWSVELYNDNTEVRIGCQMFNLEQIQKALRAIVELDSNYYHTDGEGEFVATKNGFKSKKLDKTITWADAEKLYAAIKDVK
jgi:hypothetical protein